MLDHITPVILTYNEEDNLERCLAGLTWARDIVIVDSGSTDRTLAIAEAHPNVRVFHRDFDDFAGQFDFAFHQTGITSDWILRLDADYIVSEGWCKEVSALSADAAVDGYEVPFAYAIYGKRLRASLYPPKVILGRRGAYVIRQDGHADLPEVPSGKVARIQATVDHDDRKSMTRFLWSQGRYMAREVAKLTTAPSSELDRTDRIRKKIIIAPWLVPLYLLFARGLILDGRAGLFYVLQRTAAEAVLALLLIEARFRKSD